MKNHIIKFFLIFSTVLSANTFSAENWITEKGEVLFSSVIVNNRVFISEAFDLYLVKVPRIKGVMVLTVNHFAKSNIEPGQEVEIIFSEEIVNLDHYPHVYYEYEIASIGYKNNWYDCKAWGFSMTSKPETLRSISSIYQYAYIDNLLLDGFYYDDFIKFADVGDDLLILEKERGWPIQRIKDFSYRVFNISRGTVSKTFKGLDWW